MQTNNQTYFNNELLILPLCIISKQKSNNKKRDQQAGDLLYGVQSLNGEF